MEKNLYSYSFKEFWLLIGDALRCLCPLRWRNIQRNILASSCNNPALTILWAHPAMFNYSDVMSNNPALFFQTNLMSNEHTPAMFNLSDDSAMSKWPIIMLWRLWPFEYYRIVFLKTPQDCAVTRRSSLKATQCDAGDPLRRNRGSQLTAPVANVKLLN